MRFGSSYVEAVFVVVERSLERWRVDDFGRDLVAGCKLEVDLTVQIGAADPGKLQIQKIITPLINIIYNSNRCLQMSEGILKLIKC